jgi:lipoprotein NlpD
MTKTSHLLLITAATLALVACTSTTVVRNPRASAGAPRTAPPPAGTTTVVKKGDTLYGIAFRNGLDVRDVAAWNGIGAPYTIYPGQKLRLSPRTGSQPTASTTKPPATATTPPRAGSTGVTGMPSPTGTKPATRPATPPTPPAPVPAPTPVASNLDWRWPTQGVLLNRFVTGEPTRQGIDIGGASGDPVNAAADGVVVYSGSGLVGYGELVIVKHNDNWLSAYGHNRARMVNEGAVVKAGQQIAVLGRTGAPRDMLHFEIRYNGKPVDPLLYLPRR